MTTLDAFSARPPSHRFAPRHRWDRNFFLSYVVLIWLGIGAGFGGDIVHHVSSNAAPYPWIVHLHAAAFVGWVVLFTAQVFLIRTRRIATHRRLGALAALLALAMLVLGPAAAWVVHRHSIGMPDADPAFLIVQMTDIIAFASFVFAGFVMRHEAAAHKRLMLLSTVYISDAGFARAVAEPILQAFGMHWWSAWLGLYGCVGILALGIGVYDLVTRRRLHPVYLVALVWMFALQGLALYLWAEPAWKPVALMLLGV
jgi:hypothetical protein